MQPHVLNELSSTDLQRQALSETEIVLVSMKGKIEAAIEQLDGQIVSCVPDPTQMFN